MPSQPTTNKNDQNPPPTPTSHAAETTPETEAEIVTQIVKTRNGDRIIDTKVTGRRIDSHEKTKTAVTQACQDLHVSEETDPQAAIGKTVHIQHKVSLEHREAGGQHQLCAQ